MTDQDPSAPLDQSTTQTINTLTTYKTHWLTERPRTTATLEEEAGAKLSLGEFAFTPTLSVSEARIVIEALHGKRAREGQNTLHTEVTHKMLTYLDTFARFRNAGQIASCENSFNRIPSLEVFERSQLATLCPGDAEEAKALIPSLQNKLSDEELEQLIADINAARSL